MDQEDQAGKKRSQNMNKKSPAYVLLFIILLTMFFGIAISTVHYLTLPILEKNSLLIKNRVISKAFMLEVKSENAETYKNAITENIIFDTLRVGDNEVEFYSHKYNHNIGFLFTGLGFWEAISGIIVMDSKLEKIVNLQILDQNETPGLGARIEEKWFTNQFKNLKVKWTDKYRIIIGPTSNSDKSNVVNGITGASQTSDALMVIINKNLVIFREAYMNQAGNKN